MRKKVIIGILAVLAIVFGVSAYNVIKIIWDNYRVEKTYQDLQTQYVTIFPAQTPTATQDQSAPTEPENQTPKMVVDFEALKKINKDVVGWLYCEDTCIHYPVVQGRDNSKYISTGLDGRWLVSGTLFVDFRNRSIGQDKNYIIYGHNMNSGQMFASLLKYKDQAYYDAHPTLLYLTPEGDYLIEAVAGRIVNEQEILYDPNPDPVAYETFLQNTLQNSTFHSGITLTGGENLMILSTCSQNNTTTRYVLICRITPLTQ